MNEVRLGIIGIGNMGRGHIDNLKKRLCPRVKLTAVCDTDPEKLDWAKENVPGIEYYGTDEAFFENASVDAVLIATPHYDHPPLAIEAFAHGFHVMCEKPAGVYTRQVREMNEAAQKSGKIFGIMFNQRRNPVYQKVRDLIQSGELGELKRVIWIITNWYRSQSYYDSGTWRATWAGEGGGVLLNQDPHQLDLWQWMCGMPTKIRAFMKFGAHRDIEVENDVTAYAEYENGATGLFVTGTHESPGTNRLEISGDRGKIVVENDIITFHRTRITESQFNAECKVGFGEPECWTFTVPVKGENDAHWGTLNNFADAILDGKELLAPGVEGIRGLTISNAMHLSAWTDSTVELATLDEDKFYDLLQEHIKNSTQKKKTANITLNVAGTH